MVGTARLRFPNGSRRRPRGCGNDILSPLGPCREFGSPVGGCACPSQPQRLINSSGSSLVGTLAHDLRFPPAPLTLSSQDLDALVRRWPQLEELKRSAHSSVSGGRFQHALSALLATSRCELDAALQSQRSRIRSTSLADDLPLAIMVLTGASRHSDLLSLLDGGLSLLGARWRLDNSRLAEATARLRLAVGLPCTFDLEPLPASFSEPDNLPAFQFPLYMLLFGPALAAGWPWHLSLRLFAGFGSGFSCGKGHGFVHDRGKPAPPQSSSWMVSRLSSKSDPGAVISLYFDYEAVVYVHCTRPVFRRMARSETLRSGTGRRRLTRFLPDYVRMPTNEDGTITAPRFNVTSVVERRAVWEKTILNMDGVTRLLVNGKLCYPRNDWRILPSIKPNHPSWNVPEVKEVLGKKLAVWLWQGAMEWVAPWLPRPTIIEPKGAVPKKGPDKYRDISDARIGNKSLEDWGVRYFTLRDLADGLSPRSIMFGHDISDGYHLAVLTGCTGDLVWGIGVTAIRYLWPSDPEYEEGEEHFAPISGPDTRRPKQRLVFGWRLHVGCTPENCCQTCDKSYTGMEFDGTVCRWAVAHFGQKPAGSPLNAVGLCLLRHVAMRAPERGERRGASSRTLNGVLWVDDFAFWLRVAWHAWCLGLAGGCPICSQARAAAEKLDAFWMDLCDRLGVNLNMIKHRNPGQTLEYAGFLFDTFRGLLLILAEKLVKLLAALDEWASAIAMSHRELDWVKGRVLHYSACIRHTRVLGSEISRLIGPANEATYDDPILITSEMRALARELRHVTERFAPAGAPLWALVASSTYACFLKGDVEVRDGFFSLTWDASPSGWAALLRWWFLASGVWVLRDLLLVGSWPDHSAVDEQPHRECLAASLALEAAAQAVDLRCRTGLFRNDAEAAIAALRKGSSSAPMQSGALRFARLCAELDIDTVIHHVAGLKLVEEGVDGASRGGDHFGNDANLDSTLGPSVSSSLWSQICSALEIIGWRVTVDAFATESNRCVTRFWSRFGEPGSEAVDALSVPDWRHSPCPHCAGMHREIVYAFPPSSLIRPAIRKATADAARVVLVVPVAVTAPLWSKLVSCSLWPNSDGFLRIRNPQAVLSHASQYAPKELAVFACDFSKLNPRTDLGFAPACAGAYDHRRRPLCGSPEDFSDRSRLREALLARRDPRLSA